MNKIQYTKTKLPEKWVNEQERKEYRERLAAYEERINGEIREQIEAEGLDFNLTLINELKQSETAILNKMEKAFKDYVKSVKFIPKAEYQRVEQSFLSIAERLENVNIWLNGVINNLSIQLVSKKDKVVFDEMQTEAYIETIGVRTFTDEEREYYKLIDEAIEKLIKAQHYEVDHNLPSYATEAMYICPSFDNPMRPMYQAYGAANDASKGKPNLSYFINLKRLKELKALESNLND